MNIPILPEIFNKETLILNHMDIILSTMGMFQVCDSKSVIRAINIALQVVSEHTRLPESTYQRATHGKSHWFCLNIGYVLHSRYNLLFAQCNWYPFSLFLCIAWNLRNDWQWEIPHSNSSLNSPGPIPGPGANTSCEGFCKPWHVWQEQC